MRTTWTLPFLALLLSCGDPSEVRLIVQLRTDLVPGADFFGAQLSLPDDGMEGLPIDWEPGQDFSRGERIAELPVDPSLARTVQVSLFDAAGDETVTATVLAEQRDDQVVTVVITRDCRSVVCPGEGEDAGATRCLAGGCTVPECLTGAEESCPDPECAVDSDCPSASACSQGVCSDGVCFVGPSDDRCGTDEFCDPESGCTLLPTVMETDECGTGVYILGPNCEGDGCQVQAKWVDSSNTHACAHNSDELLCWGSNSHGQLGTGDTFARLRATPVEGFGVPSQIAVGTGFTCATSQDGALFCWGRNDQGQLGMGDTVERTAPTRVESPDTEWVELEANADTVCAIDIAGALYCWGRNAEGQTGVGGSGGAPPPILSPTRVGTEAWTDVTVGEGHACGVRQDGVVYCWGRNTNGQLGVLDMEPLQVRTPVAVGTESQWASVDASPRGVCAIRTDETMACWGDSLDGRLGPLLDMTREDGLIAPTDRTGAYAEVQIDAFHGCAIRADQSGECWGRAIEGQLGVRQNEPAIEPVPVLEGQGLRAFSVARFMTHVSTQDGLFAAGNGCASMGTGMLGRVREWTPVTR
ncbi:MAG: RCC1 domain-containing protein [Sandaracinaceae bacterium]